MDKVFAYTITAFFFFTGVSSAYYIEEVEINNGVDRVVVIDPTALETFYGELRGFPHTFTMELSEPTPIVISLRIPKGDILPKNLSLLVVRDVARGVELVSRVPSESANYHEAPMKWSKTVDLQGPVFEQELPPGKYVFEVSSPDNVGKYVLLVGSKEQSGASYTQKIKALYAMQDFHELAFFHMFRSPLLYIPLLVLILGGVYILRRQKQGTERDGIVHT